MIFKMSPQDALDKTNRRIADIDANLADMAVKRATLLASPDHDSISAIQSLDKAVGAETAARSILADKAKALAEEVRKGEYASREAKRKAAIGKIGAALKKREQTAVDLQAAIERIGELYVQLTERDEAEQHWPFPRRGAGFALDLHGINKEISWALHGLVHGSRLPEPSSAGLGVTGVSALGVAQHVRLQNENIISRLEVAPIAADLLDEAI
jgi:hypothetical protein